MFKKYRMNHYCKVINIPEINVFSTKKGLKHSRKFFFVNVLTL